jgi:ribosomal protein S18 acetylase RimI-like enzyme
MPSQAPQIIRNATLEELKIAVNWAAKEGWNPGLRDAELYYSVDPTGFFMGFLDDQPVSSISAVKYGEDFGFLGFYIVKPGLRGQGYGLEVWEAAMKSLDGRNVALDGVPEQQENYHKSGFRPAFRNVRYEGQGGTAAPVDDRLVPLDQIPFSRVRAYDDPFFPAARPEFLRAWISQPLGHALGLMEDDELRGYGMMRKCRQGWKIGPLYAEEPARADLLLRALAAFADAADPVYLDVPQANPAAVNLARQHGMTAVFETARMYTGPAPDLPLDRIFGVTSFEIG